MIFDKSHHLRVRQDLEPDERVKEIRRVNLQQLFDAFFMEAKKRVAPGERLPFRVNIMEKRRTWFLWPRLEMTYMYGMDQSDPDYGLEWRWNTGLCWRVFDSGQPQFLKSPNQNKSYKMSKRNRLATHKVKAIMALPIRSAHKEDDRLHHRPDAVLNIDAISDEAAKDLADQWADFSDD